MKKPPAKKAPRKKNASAWNPHTNTGTASSAGTTDFVKLTAELETCFVQAALVLGTKPLKVRDTAHRASLRKQIAKHFTGVSSSLPPYERWPPRLHGRMADNLGNDMDVFEKLAVAYMWWLDEHYRR